LHRAYPWLFRVCLLEPEYSLRSPLTNALRTDTLQPICEEVWKSRWEGEHKQGRHKARPLHNRTIYFRYIKTVELSDHAESDLAKLVAAAQEVCLYKNKRSIVRDVCCTIAAIGIAIRSRTNPNNVSHESGPQQVKSKCMQAYKITAVGRALPSYYFLSICCPSLNCYCA
jgi:hypothetical protein